MDRMGVVEVMPAAQPFLDCKWKKGRRLSARRQRTSNPPAPSPARCSGPNGRITGWTAHIMEQLANNRLIRPLSHYTGPGERRVVPLIQRP